MKVVCFLENYQHVFYSVVVSDPKPYRKDVKKMLSNLLKLIEELEMEEIVIDRPNYSQRIRIV